MASSPSAQAIDVELVEITTTHVQLKHGDDDVWDSSAGSSPESDGRAAPGVPELVSTFDEVKDGDRHKAAGAQVSEL